MHFKAKFAFNKIDFSSLWTNVGQILYFLGDSNFPRRENFEHGDLEDQVYIEAYSDAGKCKNS